MVLGKTALLPYFQDKECIKWINFEDPILKTSENEFFENYKILEDDAETAGFDTQRLLGFDEYLHRIEEKIDAHKDGVNDETIDEIKADVAKLRSELTTTSKNGVVRRLAKIWAKVKKGGLKLLKEFYVEAKKEGFKFLIEQAKDLAAHPEKLNL